MVYYRKYRPQSISELDLVSVREKLTSILSSKQIPHAFLFTGSRGLGKTSAARILAKAINCEQNQEARIKKQADKKEKIHDSKFMIHDSNSIEPCNKCDVCISITNGSHIDIIEIDAASNRGVDEIRSLREKVKFLPSELFRKVYIIDEVHMLTNEAFNALLKTLEEPPEHVIFVLATTEIHKIPQTILSRAFSVKFENPTSEEITNSLKRIVRGEKLKIDEKVYGKVTNLSEGSFRDAAKIMEELSLNSKGENIDLELLEKVFKTGSISAHCEKLLEAVFNKDTSVSLEIIEQISNEGIDFKIIIEQMVEKLRGDLISGKSILNMSETKKILELLNEAYGGVKFAVVPQLPLELAIIEWGLDDNLKLRNQNSEFENKDAREEKEQKEEKVENKGQPSVVSLQSSVFSRQPSVIGDFLKELIEGVHKENRQVAAFLRSCKSAEVSGSNLTLITPYALHAEKLSKKEFSDLILKCGQSLDSSIKKIEIKT